MKEERTDRETERLTCCYKQKLFTRLISGGKIQLEIMRIGIIHS